LKRSRATESRIGARLLRWYDRHGRKDLPWKSGDPYHVWLSEIMLQQTQVATVIPYFARFTKRFPTIASLARADVNAVLHQWSGLGYYARARNLHRAAQILVREHGGRIPRGFDTVASLPGIGRSTAGAILAQAYGQRHPILDGNVKRALARYHAIDEPLAGAAIERRLWDLADYHTPRDRTADYTQAIMDFGATLCRRTQPLCIRCPVRKDCAAFAEGTPASYPQRRDRKRVPTRSVKMLLIRDERGRVLLQRRPPVGLWGGLWGLPELRARDVREWSQATLGLDIEPQARWPRLRHSFSHFHLDIHPIPARLVRANARVVESGDMVWYNCRQPDERGLAAPVKRLLDQLRNEEHDRGRA
jgi:A/G-specific adenine glycosylase